MTGHQPESPSSKPLDPVNPFSTRAVRPGAIDYRFPPGESPDTLLTRLQDNHWWGEIVGPHGSGKSTLIETLRQPLLDAGRSIRQFTLTAGQRRLPMEAGDRSHWDDQTQVIVDGFEQLGWWQRRSLQRACRRRGCGLLITAHASFGFPAVFHPTTSVDLTEQLVAALLSDRAAEHVSAAEIKDTFRRHAGNMREIFFDLYDRYEHSARR